MLCGGTNDCEFYGTYTQFEPICVFTPSQLQDASILMDHPINLKDDSLLEDSSLLPQMRFLFNDSDFLELSITLILSAIHLGNQGSNEKDKMRSSLRVIMESFLGYGKDKFSKIKRNAAFVGNDALEEG